MKLIYIVAVGALLFFTANNLAFIPSDDVIKPIQGYESTTTSITFPVSTSGTLVTTTIGAGGGSGLSTGSQMIKLNDNSICYKQDAVGNCTTR